MSIYCHLGYPTELCPASSSWSRKAQLFPRAGVPSMWMAEISGGRRQLGNLIKSLSKGLIERSSTNDWCNKGIFISITKGLVRHNQELISTLPCCCFSTPGHTDSLHSYSLGTLPSPYVRPGLAAASQAQQSRGKPRREQALLHPTTDFSASVQTAPFQSIYLFKTDTQTQMPFISLIVQTMKYPCFSVAFCPARQNACSFPNRL